MFSFELQTAMMRVWNTMVLDGVAVVTRTAFGIMESATRIATGEARTSWYRAPSAGPFETAGFGATAFVANAWSNPWAWTSMPTLWTAGWPAGGTSSAHALFHQPWQAWASMFSMWPAASGMTGPWWMTMSIPWSATASPSQPAQAMALPFAAYRSEGGHAVAQIKFPNAVVASVAVPTPMTPFDALFAWASPQRH